MFRKLARAIFSNAEVKLIALAITIAVWLYANSRLKEEVGLVVALNVHVPEGYQVVYQSDPQIHIRLRGPQFLVKRREDEAAQDYLQMSTTLKPADFEGGVARLRVDPRWLNVPEAELVQISATNVQPRLVTVHVSRIVTRPLPVEVQIAGKPHPGYEVRGYNAAPAQVMVTGPAAALDHMQFIKTHTVSVWDAQTDLRRPVSLALEETLTLEDETQVPVALQAQPSQVIVYVEVGGEKEERLLTDIPVQFLLPPDFPYVAQLDPEEKTVSVIVSGLPQDIARLAPDSVVAYVDLRGLRQESIDAASAPYKEQVRLLLPEDIPVTAGPPDPRQVTVVLRKPAQ